MGKEQQIEANKEDNNILERYKLLGIKGFPPPAAFVGNTLPREGEKGNILFERALSLTRKWAAHFWQSSVDKLTPEQKQNYQIIIISPRKKGVNDDFSQALLKQYENNQSLPHPVAFLERTSYEEIEYGRKIENQTHSVDSVYIVCSPTDDATLMDIVSVAGEYKRRGAKQITLIAPFIKDEREDKNVEKKPNSEMGFSGKLIKIADVMIILGRVVDRIVTLEPHSSATQAFAAINNMPLAPLSLQEELIQPVAEQIKTDPPSWVVIRPDQGRNLVATRIEKQFNLIGIHLDKTRIGLQTSINNPEQITDSLNGKNALLYDDEGGTLGTIKNIVHQLVNHKVKSITICLAHARLQKGWNENLEEIIKACQEKKIPLKIIFSDSRRPLGNLRKSIKDHPKIIQKISVARLIPAVIDACVRGVNFWTEENDQGINWALKILQPIENYD